MQLSSQAHVAAVTGGSRRVGRAIVDRLASAGFRVLFTYRSDAGDPPAPGVVALSVDLADPPTAATTIADAVADRFGRLDVLVHNASLYEPGDLASLTLPAARQLMAVNYESPLLITQAVAPLLRASGGHVVNLIDLMAERPVPSYLAYCASKAALANLTLGLAREFAPDVTVNGIAPGVVAWPADFPAESREKYLSRVPLARAGEPADVAELVHFLVTAGRYITGQIIRLDGGRSIT